MKEYKRKPSDKFDWRDCKHKAVILKKKRKREKGKPYAQQTWVWRGSEIVWELLLSEAKDQPNSNPSNEPEEDSTSDWRARADAGTSTCILYVISAC